MLRMKKGKICVPEHYLLDSASVSKKEMNRAVHNGN